jgi:hypothetical protein
MLRRNGRYTYAEHETWEIFDTTKLKAGGDGIGEDESGAEPLKGYSER